MLKRVSKKEERWQNPKPKTRKPNPNPREENGKKKRKGSESREGNPSAIRLSVERDVFSATAPSGLPRQIVRVILV